MSGKPWIRKRQWLGDLPLQAGGTVRDAYIDYAIWGTPNAPKNNIVLLPTYYGGAIAGNYPLAEGESPLNDPRWCIVIPGMLGAGESISPSNSAPGQEALHFPVLRVADQVHAQARLLSLLWGEYQLALVAGWSLGGMQSLQWANLYPERVHRVGAWCTGTRCYPHNRLFLEGLRACLTADPHFTAGGVPTAGLKAFARVYASRAYGAGFVRNAGYEALGYGSLEALLEGWEADHLAMDAHDLHCVLDMWAHADLSDNPKFQRNRVAALKAIRQPGFWLACPTDQYFVVEESAQDAVLMPNVAFSLLNSEWGHCAGGPGREPASMAQVFAAMRQTLSQPTR